MRPDPPGPDGSEVHGPLDPPPRARLRRGNRLRLIGVGMVGALALVVALEFLTHARQQQRFAATEERAAGFVRAAETEYWRLREQWGRAVDERTPLDGIALRTRYAAFAEQFELLRAAPVRSLLEPDAASRRTLAALERLRLAADPVLGALAAGSPQREFARRLWPEVAALAEPMRTLVLDATRHATLAAERARHGAAVDHLLMLALLVIVAALWLAYALGVRSRLHSLRTRRHALEGLAGQLRAALQDAKAASRAKSVFLANIGHEIRTPFHGLMGMLSLLRESGLDARQLEYLRTATESADHLLAVLNDVLDLAQLESGHLALVPAAVDLRELLRDTEAAMRQLAAAKSLALHVDTGPAVPEWILADAARLRQVLVHLLTNAIKFTDRGSVTLAIGLRDGAQGDAELEFVVSDTGIGMDAHTLGRLFSRTAQVDGPRSRHHPGVGLGLELSRGLARLMGGDINVHSEPGSGSTFSFAMPLRLAPEHGRVAGRRTAFSAPRALRVLVADDHPINRQYLAALLTSMGHETRYAHNGHQAVAEVREQPFDLVLMDLHMPELDGIGATRAIRAMPGRDASTVPIVALTADAHPDTRELCLVTGMNDFLTKPVSPQTLAATLRRLFGAGVGTTPAGGPAAAPVPPAQEVPLVDEAAVQMALQAVPRAQLASMIGEFLDQAPQTVERLRAALRDGQPLELRVNAHAAKGAALNLGLASLAATADALHQGAAHLPAHEVARLVDRYEDLVTATRAAALDLALLPLAAPAPVAAGLFPRTMLRH